MRGSALLGLTVATMALAAPPSSAVEVDADADYEAGKAALKAREFGVAIDAFERALASALEGPQAWRALLGLALGHELAGDALRGAVHYRRFLARSASSPLAAGPEWGPRRIEAATTAERLERELAVTHARVVVTSAPSGARVALRPESPHACAWTPCELFVPPGPYIIDVTLPDGEVHTRTIEAQAGHRHDVAAAAEGPVAIGATEGPSAISRIVRPAATWPPAATWTIVGGGVAVVAGVVLTGLAAGDHDRLEDLAAQAGTDDVLRRYDETLTRMQARETASWVLYAVGGVAVVTGLVLGLTAGDAEPTGPGALGWRF